MENYDLGSLVVKLGADTSQYDKLLNAADAKLLRFGKKLETTGRSMTKYITAPLAAVQALSTKAFSNFDDSMTKSLAIMSGITPKIRKEMERTAMAISSKNITSSNDLAKAYFYLASAGMDAAQSMAALPAMEKFAAAGAFDMALATDLATDAQSALGLTVKDATENTQNLVKVTDVLIKANTLANASTVQFSESLTNKVGSALKILNKDMEEGVAVLAAYADQGVKGMEAGEKFNIFSRDLQTASINQAAAWKNMGIAVYDNTGKMLNYADVIEQLETRMMTMSDQQKKMTFEMLGFQDRSVIAVQQLLGLSDKIRFYEKELRKAGGTTQDVAEKQLKSFSSQMKIMWNNVVNAAIGIGAILAPSMLKLNQYVIKSTEYWGGLNSSTQEWIVKLGVVAAAAGPVIWGLGKMIIIFVPLKSLIVGAYVAMVGFMGGITAGALAVVGSIALLVGSFYVLRAAAIQGTNGVREALNATYNFFKVIFTSIYDAVIVTLKGIANLFRDTFLWIYDTVANSFIGKLIKAFTQGFKIITQNWKKIVAEIAGNAAFAGELMAGIVKGHGLKTSMFDADTSYTQTFQATMAKLNAFTDGITQTFQTAKLEIQEFGQDVKGGLELGAVYLQAFGLATAESFMTLMDSTKTQMDSDFGWIEDKFKGLLNGGGEGKGVDALSPMIQNSEKTEKSVFEQSKNDLKVMATDSQRMIDALNEEYRMLGTINDVRERAVQKEAFKAQLQKDYIGDLAKQQSMLEKYEESLKKLGSFQARFAEYSAQSLDIWGNLASVATGAIDNISAGLTQMIMEGKAEWKDMAKSILADITTIMIRATLVKSTLAIFGFGMDGSKVSAEVKHSGGMVGSGSTRSVSAAAFVGAPRLHNGLAGDEFPAILQKGESVIPKGGRAGSIAPSVQINISNNSNSQIKADSSGVKFDGRKFVVDVVVENINSNGVLRRMMKS